LWRQKVGMAASIQSRWCPAPAPAPAPRGAI
jgi:hypothetical protein